MASRFHRHAFLVVAALWLVTSTSQAATRTWDGGVADDSNWTNVGNWDGVVPVPGADDLVFAGTNDLSPNNDFPVDSVFNGISFSPAAGSFTLGGNGIVLAGDINNNSGAAQTIGFTPVNVTANGNLTYAAGGLVLDGATSNVSVSAGGSLALGQVTFGLAPLSANVSTLNLNNSVSASGLTVQTNSAGTNAINVATGQTFTVNGSVSLGTPATADIDPDVTIPTNVNFTGGGSLSVTSGNFYVGLGSQNFDINDRNVARVDMTGLANFSYTGGGNFGVGWMTRPDAQLRLPAGTNTIVANQMKVGDSRRTGTDASPDNNGTTARLFLGAGNNIIQTDVLHVGRKKGSAVIDWQVPGSGSVSIAAQDGIGRTDIQVGNFDSGSATGVASQIFLAGHNANVLADEVIIGRLNASGSAAAANEITFDTGSFDVNSLQLARNVGSTGANGVSGTFTLGTDALSTGVLTVNNEFFLGWDTNTNAAPPTKAIFNINGGTANLNTDIQSITNGDTTNDISTINLNAGTLNMMGHNIGSAASPVKEINLNGGNLTNAARIAGRTVNLGAAANLTGTPTFVVPDAGTLNSGLPTLNLVSGGGIEGGGASGGSVTGNVAAQSGSHVGVGLDSTLTFSNDLSLSGGSHLDVTANTSPIQPSINVTGSLTTSGGSGSIPINVSGVLTAGSTYTVVDYVNSIGGSGYGAFALGPLPPRVVANLVNNAGNLSVDLNVISVDRAKWTGAQSTQWSTATLPAPKNWTLVTAGGQTDYVEGDNPLFDDSATNTNVDVSVADVLPAAVEFNNTTKNYTVTGSKSIISTGTFTKTGTGTVTLAVPATFGGAASVAAGGTLQIGNGGTTGNLTAASLANEGTLRFNHTGNVAFSTPTSGSGNVVHAGTGTTTLSGASTYSGATNIQAGTVRATSSTSLGDTVTSVGAVTISSGAALDVGGSNTANSIDFGNLKEFFVQGTGVGGSGVLTNSNATVAQQNAFEKVTLTGPATFGGAGRFDIRLTGTVNTANLNLQGNTLTKVGPNQFTLVAVNVDDGNIVVNEGTFALETTTSVPDNLTGTKFTFNDGTTLQFFNKAAGGITRPMEFNGTVTVRNADDDTTSTLDSPVKMFGAATYTWANSAGAGNPTTQNGVISEMGGARGIEVRTVNALNVLNLTADNTFTGSLAVSGPGTLNISPLSTNAWIADTANVSLDTNSIMNLGFSGSDTINALIINGVSLAAGVYGSGTHPTNFTGGGTLTVLNKILPGDFDNNAVVDARDYVKWRDNEGTFTILANDPLSGTEIDTDQYNIWRSHFGNTLPGSGGGAGLQGAVPEPTTAALVLVAYGLACSVVRRRSSK